jgi:asparagine synthase (glutamine-hydrolysing)
MCGIAGWVDFDADLRDARETIEAMTASMALRGPDDEGTWLSPHAALGHRRLAVIDIEGGVQPMVAEGDVVLTYSGEVYNYKELRAELIALGHEFRTVSDTEVVLRAYLEWGAESFERLNGMYAFGIWDGRSEELFLVRDRLGVKPLYYYPLPNGLLFGSEPKAILANPQTKREVDSRGICSLLTGLRTPGMSIFRDLFELRPGRYLKLSRSGTVQGTYWELQAREHEDDLQTTVARVRELLEDIVPRHLVADVPLCMLLSGGLDSSVLVALARQVKGSGGSLRTFAIDFADESFSPDSVSLVKSRDSPFANELAQELGVSHKTLGLDTDRLLDADLRLRALKAMDTPANMGDTDMSLYLLFEAIRQESTVAVSGEAADEVFGGYPWMHDEAAIALPIFPWVASMMQNDEGMSSLTNSDIVQRFGILEYMMEQYNDSVAEAPHLDDEDPTEHRMREVMFQHLTRFLPNLLDRKDRMSMATGLEVRVPFCDHRLVEYVFNTPWSMKTADGREKSLLRMAASDLVPTAILEREKSAYPVLQDPRYDEGLRAIIGEIARDRDDRLRDVFGTADLAMLQEGGPELSYMRRLRQETAVRLSRWFKEYEVDFVEA